MYRRKVRIRNNKKIDEGILDRLAILITQVELIGNYLESIWVGKKGANFKYPNIEQLRYELSFNDLFIDGLYQEALKCKEIRGEIYIDTEKDGIKRIYDSEKKVF